MENHMEKTLENDMGTVLIEGFMGIFACFMD